MIDAAEAAILKQLQKRQGWSPKELVEATGAKKDAIRRACGQLVKAKAIVIVGRGRGQRISLPGKSPAKEVP